MSTKKNYKENAAINLVAQSIDSFRRAKMLLKNRACALSTKTKFYLKMFEDV